MPKPRPDDKGTEKPTVLAEFSVKVVEYAKSRPGTLALQVAISGSMFPGEADGEHCVAIINVIAAAIDAGSTWKDFPTEHYRQDLSADRDIVASMGLLSAKVLARKLLEAIAEQRGH